jgi:hypothetical protein
VEAVFRSRRPASICPAGASEGDAYTWGERLPRPAARTRKKWTPAQPYRGRASGTAASICALNLSGAPHRGRRLRKHLRSLLGKRKPRNRYKHLSPIAFRKTRHCKHLHCQRGVRKHLRTLRADLIGQPCARGGRVASGPRDRARKQGVATDARRPAWRCNRPRSRMADIQRRGVDRWRWWRAGSSEGASEAEGARHGAGWST